MLTQTAGWFTVTQYKLHRTGGIVRLLKLHNSEQFLPSNIARYESNSQTSSLLSWGTKRTGWVYMSPTPNIRGPFVLEKQVYLTSSKLQQSVACFTLQIILIHLCHTGNVKLSHNKPWRLRGGMECSAWHLAQLWWQRCQHYVPATLYPQANSLVLISVTAWVVPGLLNAERRNKSLENFQGS